jgi:hypothetical protein
MSGDRRRMERVRADWSARFDGESSAVVTGNVVDLSMISVRVRPDGGNPDAVVAGQTGTLTLAFPDSETHMEVIRLAATVVRAGMDGIAFTFTGLPDAASRWLGARVLTTEVRRRSPRVPLETAVELRMPYAAPIPAMTLDLSAYGARVRTVAPLEPGARLDLVLPLSAERAPMVVPTVVWSVEDDEAVLTFINLGPRDFNRLGDYVASRLGPRG